MLPTRQATEPSHLSVAVEAAVQAVLQIAPVLAAVTTVQTRPWVPCACVPLACSWVTTCRIVKHAREERGALSVLETVHIVARATPVTL